MSSNTYGLGCSFSSFLASLEQQAFPSSFLPSLLQEDFPSSFLPSLEQQAFPSSFLASLEQHAFPPSALLQEAFSVPHEDFSFTTCSFFSELFSVAFCVCADATPAIKIMNAKNAMNFFIVVMYLNKYRMKI